MPRSEARATRDPAPQPAEGRTHARSLRAGNHDAVLTGAMNGLTETFMIPYVLAIGATPFQAGLLSSARNLLLALVQLGTSAGVRRLASRRKLVLITATVQAVLWLPLAFAVPLFEVWAVPAIIALYTLGTAASSLGGPAWASLIADHVAPAERGRYFGHRARLSGVAVMIAGLVAGAILHFNEGRPVLGFGLLCVGAFLFRSLAIRALRRVRDWGWREDPHLHFSFFAFLRRAGKSNYARFSLCIALNGLAAHVSAPFFTVYLLESLGYGYLEYTLVTFGGALTGMLSSSWWGHVSDRTGNYAVLRWTTLGVTVLPVLWMVNPHPVWMIAVNVLGAFMWGGLNLAAANYTYDAVTPGRRHTCIAYFNVLNGLGVSVGAFLGGALVAWHPAEPGSVTPYFVVFAVSAILRVGSAIAFRGFVREVRTAPTTEIHEVTLDLAQQRLMGVLNLLTGKSLAQRITSSDSDES